MDMRITSLSFCLSILLLCSVLSLSQARPLDAAKSSPHLKGLSLGAVKDSGPSPGGGHPFADSQTFGDVKESGPSPGSNNFVVTSTHH
ncbi:hypothetical protein NMG60_11005917 [Bertholletia excelsa]